MEDSWAKQDAALFGLPVRREVYQGVAAQAAPADDVALALRRSSADERRSAAARADTSDDAALAAALGRSLAADAGDAAGDAALARALAANDARRGADDARCYDSDAALAALLAASDSASDLRPEARHEDGWPHDGPGGRGPHDGPGPSSREPQKDVSFEGARREACEKIAEIRSLCAAAGVGRFVDPDFGPGSRSQTDTAGGARAWRRPEELQFDGDRRLPTGFFSPRTPACWRVFDGQPRAADVRQGAVGDCWFVSALSALASFRNGALIRRLFAGAADFDDGRGGGDAKNFGAHAVQLCVRGAWEVVVVDELLPVSGDGVKTCVQLAYASCARRQLWAPLLEKAYAKICRGYSNLSGGDTAEALYVLTGCACGKTALSPSLSDEARELLWAELLSAHEAGFVTCLSSRATVRRGLSPRHAYAVLDVLSVGPRRLLRVANPHDTKPACLVEASVVAEARRRVPDDGRSVLFDLDDVLENFEHCCVCEYRSDWADVRLDAAPRDVYVVTAPEATEATLHYAQAPARARAGGPLDAALVVVAARDADGGGAAATATAGLGNAYCRCHLNGGEERYYVVPLSFNGAGAAQTCGVLVAQSARPLLLARAPHVDAALVRRCVLAYARSGAAPQRFGAVTHYARTDGCACYIAAENRDVGRWLRFTISFDDARGVVLSRGSPGNGTTVTSHVPPGHACVVVVAAARAEGFRYRASSKFQLGEAPPPGQEHAPPLPTPDDIHVPVPLDHFR